MYQAIRGKFPHAVSGPTWTMVRRTLWRLTVLAPFALAGCTYALVGGLLANRLSRESPPVVRSWGDSVTLAPTGVTVRLPADSVTWRAETVQGSTGQTATVLVGDTPDGGRAALYFSWAEERNCDKVNDLLVHSTLLGNYQLEHARTAQDSAAALASAGLLEERAAWFPAENSGWTVPWLMAGGHLGCYERAGRPFLVHVISLEPRGVQNGIERRVRTLLWVVGDAAHRAAGKH